MASPLPTPPRPRVALRPLWRAAGWGVLALACLYGVALVALSRPAAEAALRRRILAGLRASVGDVTLGPDVHVSPLLRVSFGPLAIAGARPGAPPVLRVERIEARPRLLALLAGRAELASVRMTGVRVEAGRSGRSLLELGERLRGPPARRGAVPARAPAAAAPEPAPEADEAAPWPSVQARALVIAFVLGGKTVELGPIDAHLSRARGDGEERLRADLRLPGGGTATVDARREASGWRATLGVRHLGPAAIPEALGAGAVSLREGTLSLDATLDAAPDLSRLGGRAVLAVEGASVAGERIGAEPLGPISATAEGDVAWEGAERRVSLSGGRVVLFGAIPAAVSGQARLGPGLPFELSVRLDRLDFAAAVAALPAALGLPPEAPRPAGTLDAHLDLAGPLLAPAAWTVDAGLDLSRMRDAARRAPPVALRAPFVHRPEVEHGTPPEILVGPRNPAFVPLASLPQHVIRAVTASEDAGFYGHSGFEFEELRNAFAASAERGRLVRGGSTISQQLAKNLYLSREKTLARKVREAALTVALEATVPKARLLEIYLNVAEWGPGLWGIGPAARHWFGVPAAELTPRQAAFLATVIPNPVRFHFMWARGAPTEAWDQRVDELLLKMAAQQVLDPDALDAALVEPLAFARPGAAVGPGATPAP
ncbi:glycosyl transferase family 51 [Anaeromyxobacter sp. K]|uniref:biosynthetic peptidoglycan transglycosylase n=1 Tax=Anaeromyxobacter sp. (strain K) TaxID=447217 RepID=UPI00015F96B5|nr:biosynthetic peptidoglycan transglycosylase [Anaeromyxobacter sp. K]ACG73852.1 glycosyl transferase family 51 [Anaeromyxobacter sp. K]